jgi:lysophospholipase L1-like esterase
MTVNFENGRKPDDPMDKRKRSDRSRVFGNSLLLVGSVVLCVLFSELAFRLVFDIGFTKRPLFYEVNSLGFRGPEPSKSRRNSANKRILLLGDSYTFGVGVPAGAVLSSVLGKKMEQYSNTPIEVLNFGRMGWNAKAEIDFLLSEGKQYDADTVVLVYTFNDIELAAYELEAQKSFLWFMQFTMLHSIVYQMYMLKQRLVVGVSDYREQLKNWYVNKDSPEWRQVKHSIVRLLDYCRENGKELVILYFEVFDHSSDSLRSVPMQAIRAFSQKNGIPFVALPPIKPGEEEAYKVHRFDAHPNAKGHELAANALAAYFDMN